MSFMNWSKDYELGIPEMDIQHQKWLELLNNFYDHLSTGDFGKKLQTLLMDAFEYTQYHFQEEEKLMKIIDYESLNEQKEMHKAITNKIVDFKNKLENNQHIVSLNITSEFKTWFNQHIMIEDKKYATLYLAKMKEHSLAS